jgi:PAS domain S-box-containing protein
MPEFLRILFDTSDFPARWNCGNWSAAHGWTHILSDLAIWGAYTAIPLVLAVAAIKRRDLGFPRAMWLFVAFILACSMIHLVDAVIFWHPVYRISTVTKVVTAIVSWITVIVLIYYGPRLLQLSSITEINLKLDREVKQRRNAEQKLREQADILQLALAAGDVGTWRWDLNSDQDTRDAGLNTILGLSPRTTTQPVSDFFERIHPEDRDAVLASVNAAKQDCGEYTAEMRIIRPDGSVRWVRDRGRQVFDAEGKPELMTGAVVDITESRQAQEEIARLAAIVESSPDAIVLQSIDGKILSWNVGAEKIFGYSAKEAIGRSIDLIVPQERAQELAGYREAAKRGEEIPHFETVRRRKDGTLIDVWLGISGVHDDQGRLIGLSAIERNITERKRHDEQLERLNRELAAKNDEMEQFVYIVSHDLKSPLVTVISFVDLVREDLGEQVPDDVADSLNRIQSAAKRMSQLIDDLLELSRVGRIKHDSRPVMVGALVDELRVDLEEMLDRANAEVIVETDLGNIDGHPRRIRQAVQNLLTNAAKYGCTHYRSAIRIGMERMRHETRLYVRDDGPGINREYQERIFRVFERANDQVDGTGVGLALVAKIMEAHKGRVWVDSNPGEGATFWLAFPNGKSGTESKNEYQEEN